MKIITLLSMLALFSYPLKAHAIKTNNFAIVTNGDMSGVIDSAPVPLIQNTMVSIQAAFTGAPSGTLKIQVSDDAGVIGATGAVTGLTNWSDYTGSQVTVSSAGNQAYDIWATSARWAQLVYTPTSGSGSLNAQANTKGP